MHHFGNDAMPENIFLVVEGGLPITSRLGIWALDAQVLSRNVMFTA